ncbi:golgin subfamily A member 4-like [Diaphorina citri]|uniref:Golgin subfamily A member 4-like n=1 Tax=Diaphorina citri TaxID=121845 RepID=A0A3Q0IWE5_DIACI|nr:golgin subfamily A member 4-like [Diaphorina citri]
MFNIIINLLKDSEESIATVESGFDESKTKQEEDSLIDLNEDNRSPRSSKENQDVVNMEADGREKESVSLKKLQAVDLLKQELQKKLESEGALEKALEEKKREYLELKQALETTNSEFKQTLEQKNREFLDFTERKVLCSDYPTSPEPGGFMSIDLRAPDVSRKSSLIFPVYESPPYLQNRIANERANERDLEEHSSPQQPPQAVTPQATPNDSFTSSHNDSTLDTSRSSDYPTSPEPGGFMSIDLRAPDVSRKSSLIFPVYESPPYLQSDMESASEVESSLCSSQRLGHVTKESLYSSYQQVHSKYQKYKGRYVEMLKAYKKLEAVMSESQDVMLRKNAELKEQCQLEQKAKAHLEDMLRNDLEEKDHIINTLNTKVSITTYIILTLLSMPALTNVHKDDASSAQLTALRSELTECNAELSALREKQEADKSSLAETKLNFHRELESKEILVREFKAQISQLKLENTNLQDQMVNMEADGREKESVSLKKLHIIFIFPDVMQNESEGALEKALEEKNREFLELKQTLEQKNGECEKVKQALEQKNVNCTELKHELEEVQKRLEAETNLEKSLEQKNRECQELKHKMEELESTLETLKTSNDEMIRNLETELCTPSSVDTGLEQELNQLRLKLKEMEDTSEQGKRDLLSNHQKEMDLEKTNHQKELEEEKTKHSQFIKQIENTLKSKENEIVRTLEEKDQTIFKLKNKLQSAYEKFNADKTKLEASVKNETGRLEGKLNALTEDNAKLKQVRISVIIKNMFKKLKDKITEEVKAAPRNLFQPSPQQPPQAVTPQATPNDSFTSSHNDSTLDSRQSCPTHFVLAGKSRTEDVKVLSSKLKAAEVKISEQDVNIKQLEDTVATMKKTLHRNICDMLNTMNQQPKSKLEEINSVLETIKAKSCDNIAKLNEMLLEKEAEHKTQLSVLEKINEDLKTQVHELSKEKEANERKQEEFVRKIEHYENTLNNKNDEYKTQKKHKWMNYQKKKKYDELSKEKEVNEKKQEEFVRKIEHYENTLNNKNDEYKTQKDLEHQYKTTIEKLLEDNAKLVTQIDVLKKEFDGKLKEETDKFKQMQQELDTKLDTETKLMKELENMKTISQEQESKIRNIVTTELEQTHKEKVGDLKHLIAKLEEDMEHGKRDIKKQVEEKEKLKKTIELQEQEISSLQNHKKEIEASNSQVNERLAKLSIENEDLIKEKTLLQEKHTQLSTELSTLRENRSKSKEVLEKMNLMTKENSELLSEKEQLTKVLSTLQEEMKETSSSHERQVNELHNELTRLKALNEELNSKSKELNELHNELTRLKALNEELNLKSKEALEKTNLLTKKTGELTTEKERLNQLVATLQNEIEDNKSKQIQNNTLQNELQKTNLLTKETGELTTEKERLNQLVATLQNEIEDNKSKQIQNNTLQNELQEELTKVKALNAELSSKSNEAIEKINILTQQNKKKEEVKELRRLLNLGKPGEESASDVDSSKLQEKDQGNGQLAELQNELSKYKSANTEMKSFTEKYRVNLVGEKQLLSQSLTSLQNEVDSSKLQEKDQGSGQLAELQNELSKYKSANTEMKIYDGQGTNGEYKPGEDSASDVEGETDKNKEDKLGSCLELEYLRNVLFEYMMGKEPMVLARVLAAIVKFDPEHTAKILHREEQKLSVVSLTRSKGKAPLFIPVNGGR